MRIGEILKILDELKAIFQNEKFPQFVSSIDILIEVMGQIVIEQLSYHVGMSYFFNIYELLEKGLDSFFKDKNSFDFFYNKIERLSLVLGIGTDVAKVIEEAPKEDEIIQEIPENIMEDISLLADFITEAGDNLDSAEAKILHLEKKPNNQEYLDAVFRIMHTLKGSSGFFNLSAMSKLAHNTEDILSQIRIKKLKISPEILEVVLKSIDTLRKLLSQLKDIMYNNPTKPIKIGIIYDLQERCIKGEIVSKETHKIGEILVATGQITQEQLEEALEQQQISKKNIDEEKTTKEQLLDVIKIPTHKLNQLIEFLDELVVSVSMKRFSQLDKITGKVHDWILSIKMFPINNVFSKLYRHIRDISSKCDKQINFIVEGGETLVDKTIIDGIYAPLMHLIRNAIDHGIENVEARKILNKNISGTIKVSASRLGDIVILQVSDDGKGLHREAIIAKAIEKEMLKETKKSFDQLSDQEVFEFIFKPGFSTAKGVTDISGRGVGMDVVKRDVEALRGKVIIESKKDKGTNFTIKLPLSTVEGLVVRIGASRFVIPILDINQIITPKKENLLDVCDEKESCFILAGEVIPIIPLYKFYQINPDVSDPTKAIIIVINFREKKFGLMVDEFLRRQQIVIRDLDIYFNKLPGISGMTILGDGRVGWIIDPSSLINLN
ncbi:MAG: chemotaxis protein CheA [Desulfobacterales bacterium]|nr:chemotaxis protein CheA [Desulfobacterales bacterium]